MPLTTYYIRIFRTNLDNSFAVPPEEPHNYTYLNGVFHINDNNKVMDFYEIYNGEIQSTNLLLPEGKFRLHYYNPTPQDYNHYNILPQDNNYIPQTNYFSLTGLAIDTTKIRGYQFRSHNPFCLNLKALLLCNLIDIRYKEVCRIAWWAGDGNLFQFDNGNIQNDGSKISNYLYDYLISPSALHSPPFKYYIDIFRSNYNGPERNFNETLNSLLFSGIFHRDDNNVVLDFFEIYNGDIQTTNLLLPSNNYGPYFFRQQNLFNPSTNLFLNRGIAIDTTNIRGYKLKNGQLDTNAINLCDYNDYASNGVKTNYRFVYRSDSEIFADYGYHTYKIAKHPINVENPIAIRIHSIKRKFGLKFNKLINKYRKFRI